MFHCTNCETVDSNNLLIMLTLNTTTSKVVNMFQSYQRVLKFNLRPAIFELHAILKQDAMNEINHYKPKGTP